MSTDRVSDHSSDPEGALQRTFGANLKALRVRRGMTQAQLATAAGLTRTHISTIEAGESDLRFSTADKLSRAVGTTVLNLLQSSVPTEGPYPISGVVPPQAGMLALEMPTSEALAVAIAAAASLGHRLALVDPVSREVKAVVGEG